MISAGHMFRSRDTSLRKGSHSGNKKNSQKIIEDDPSEEWQKRKDKLLTKEERMLVERFKVDYHKNITTTNKNKLKLV